MSPQSVADDGPALECPEKPTKSPPLSRIFAARPTYHTPQAHFIWRDSEIFHDKGASAAARVLPLAAQAAAPIAPSDTSEYFETHFTNASEIGKGEFATVWKARFIPDGKCGSRLYSRPHVRRTAHVSSRPLRWYAVKKSKREFKSARDRELALQEVRNVMVIKKHRHCVQYAQAWEQRGHLFIQMELCDRSLMDQAREPLRFLRTPAGSCLPL